MIWRECGVRYHVHDVATLLHHLGLSFQKARFVSDHLDALRRQEWLLTTWPGRSERPGTANGRPAIRTHPWTASTRPAPGFARDSRLRASDFRPRTRAAPASCPVAKWRHITVCSLAARFAHPTPFEAQQARLRPLVQG